MLFPFLDYRVALLLAKTVIRDLKQVVTLYTHYKISGLSSRRSVATAAIQMEPNKGILIFIRFKQAEAIQYVTQRSLYLFIQVTPLWIHCFNQRDLFLS